MSILTTFVLCGLVLGAAAYSPTRPLLHIGCDGTIDVFPQTGVTAIHINAPTKLFSDTFVTALKARVLNECPSITDAQFQYAFSYGPGYFLNLFRRQRVWSVPGCDSSIFGPAVLGLQEFPFDRTRIIVNWPNAESTCSFDRWQSGQSCAMQLSLPKYSVSAVLNMGHCSNSLWPEISIYCDGANCDKIGKLCDSDADCPSPTMCWRWGFKEDDLWDIATEIGIYNESDTKPGCKNVLTMFDELKEYAMSQVFTATALVETPDVSICMVNLTALEENPLDTLEFTDLINTTSDHYGCKNYCTETTGPLPLDFPPSFSTMIPGECTSDRYFYYCNYLYEYANRKGLSMCERMQLEMTCALKVGCDSSHWSYANAFDNCVLFGCPDCTPVLSWNPTDYPQPLYPDNCTRELRQMCSDYASKWYYYHQLIDTSVPNYCRKYELALQCENYIGCSSGENFANSSCYDHGCDNACTYTNTTLNINVLSSYTGSAPSYPAPTVPAILPLATGSSTLLKHTCNGWIVLFPESTFSVKLHLGHQDALSWLQTWLKAPTD